MQRARLHGAIPLALVVPFLSACSLTLDFGKFGEPSSVDGGSDAAARDGTTTPSDGGGVDAPISDVDGCATAVELCNGVDDDCNGMTDEGFDLESDPRNCGACGRTCGGTYACTMGVCGSRPSAIALGARHSCVLLEAGELFCWGDDSDYQLGTGLRMTTETPARVAGSVLFRSVATGGAHTCAVARGGALHCWGANRNQQCGFDSSGMAIIAMPRAVTAESSVSHLSLGAVHSCLVSQSTGEVRCAGHNTYLQTGQPGTSIDYRFTTLMGVTNPRALALGANSTCIITSGSGVSCWGSNADRQLGVGTPALSGTPISVPGISSARSIAVGEAHACVVSTGGAIGCWGKNDRGQAGQAASSTDLAPMPVTATGPFEQIAAGAFHTCALRTDGTVSCFGGNDRGQLGIGSADAMRETPTDVAGLSNVRALAAGGRHTCAITDDDQVWCWGDNEYLQIGQPDSVDSVDAPRVVTGPWTPAP
jgi:alpha-tubulin suppressor-like RCC1 family protein